MPTILIICSGNVCRSPVVEALLARKLEQLGKSDFHVCSAGTAAFIPKPASRFSVEIMRERESIDLSSHRSKCVTKDMVDGADLILCMEVLHKKTLISDFPVSAGKVYLLHEIAFGTSVDVPDPYGQSKSVYMEMIDDVTELVDQGLDHIIERVSDYQPCRN